MHSILGNESSELMKQWGKLQSEHQDILVELVLLAMADTLWCQLKDNDFNEFLFRVNFYKKMVEFLTHG